MLNAIWIGMMILSVIVGVLTGHLNDVALSVTNSAALAFQLVLSLAGIMTFWLGIMEIAKASGLMTLIANALKPILTYLFPQVPTDDPAMGAIVLNIAANMLGLANAATPFGLQAMKALERLNPTPGEASDAMCMLLAINTSSVQLIPATAIAYLAANGASHPMDVIVSALIATSCSTLVALFAVKHLAKWKRYRPTPPTQLEPWSNETTPIP